MKIERPGIFTDIAAADYFADPCPSPSLTQSIAKILLDTSPLHAWTQHPRLNPDYRSDDDRKFDVGNIAHALLIGRGKDIVVIDAPDWRTKAAKDTREELSAKGKLAVLAKHHALAQRMVNAAREQLELRNLDLFSSSGDGEAVLAWQDEGIWLRQMVDWLSHDRAVFADYKTTDMSVAPHVLGRRMADAGWHIQAAMADRGLMTLHQRPGLHRRYLFVVQETDSPYCLNVVEINRDVLLMGHKMLDHAIQIWRACINANRFPGYPTEIITPEFPAWAEQQWLDREIHEAARGRMTDNVLMAG